jgi:hypothetical protein
MKQSVCEGIKIRNTGIIDPNVVANIERNTETEHKTHRQILIATGGSKASENAVYLGIKFACQYGVKVYALFHERN